MATHQGTGVGSHIVQGMFATLLATPCSAPFLGTAIAWALAAPLPALWSVFIALGIGMSLPWLLVAWSPGIVLLLPKPGRWMIRLRAFFGAMMLASSYWLLSLLANFIGRGPAIAFAVVMALGLLIALSRHYGVRFACKVAGWSALVAVLILLIMTLSARLWSNSLTDNIPWQPLSEQALNKALAARQRVFIDVTADWCITCKVNELNVLLQPSVQQALRTKDVVALRGYWTHPSQTITEFLHQYGQVAVPFNQIYGPGIPQGKILPPLLDSKTVLDVLNQASGEKP